MPIDLGAKLVRSGDGKLFNVVARANATELDGAPAQDQSAFTYTLESADGETHEADEQSITSNFQEA